MSDTQWKQRRRETLAGMPHPAATPIMGGRGTGQRRPTTHSQALPFSQPFAPGMLLSSYSTHTRRTRPRHAPTRRDMPSRGGHLWDRRPQATCFPVKQSPAFSSPRKSAVGRALSDGTLPRQIEAEYEGWVLCWRGRPSKLGGGGWAWAKNWPTECTPHSPQPLSVAWTSTRRAAGWTGEWTIDTSSWPRVYISVHCFW